MKKLAWLLTAFLLVSCGGGKEAVKKETPKTFPQRTTQQTTVNPQLRTQTKSISPDSLAKLLSKKQTPAVNVSPTVKQPIVKPDTSAVKSDSPKRPVELKPVQKDTTKTATTSVTPQPPATEKVVAPGTVKIPVKATSTFMPIKGQILHFLNMTFDDIFFERGEWKSPSTKLNGNYMLTLNKIVKILKSDESLHLRITGYADNDGASDFNREVSEKRAVVIGNRILDFFPPDDQIIIGNRIEIKSEGDSKPLVEGAKGPSSLNRRVSFELFDGTVEGKTLMECLKTEQEQLPKPGPIVVVRPASDVILRQEKLYANASHLMESKKYDMAMPLFEQIVKIDSSHPLADNAQYWIGEAFFSMKNYQDALSAFMKVFGLGDRNKEAYAQLRIGFCYLNLDQSTKAVDEFQKVLKNYPSAKEEVRKARSALAKLQSK